MSWSSVPLSWLISSWWPQYPLNEKQAKSFHNVSDEQWKLPPLELWHCIVLRPMRFCNFTFIKTFTAKTIKERCLPPVKRNIATCPFSLSHPRKSLWERKKPPVGPKCCASWLIQLFVCQCCNLALYSVRVEINESVAYDWVISLMGRCLCERGPFWLEMRKNWPKLVFLSDRKTQLNFYGLQWRNKFGTSGLRGSTASDRSLTLAVQLTSDKVQWYWKQWKRWAVRRH